MKKLILIMLILIILQFILLGKEISLSEIINPESIVVDSNRVFITEEASVSIYSLKDFKLLKKFGRKGQGPGEFLTAPGVNINLYVCLDYLFINSISKVSIYTKEGEFVKEIRTSAHGSEYQPLGEMFVGSFILREGNVQYLTINLYDENFKKKKEIFRQESPFQHITQEFDPLTQIESFIKFYSGYNKIFINDERGVIHVFEPSGKEIFSVKHDYGTLKVSKSHREEVYDFYRMHPGTKMIFEAIKNKMKFPKYFPVIRDYKIADNKIYILPYAKKKGRNCFYIFDMKGDLLKEVPVIIKERNILELFPYSIKGGNLYQLVDNEGKWELHIESIVN